MRELVSTRLTQQQADEIEIEMRRLEADPGVTKNELRLFMQSLMPCGHPVGCLLTCDLPPFGCLECNAGVVLRDATHYVVGFMFHGDRVLLIEKARPRWQAGRLNGVGGHVEVDEDFHAAMVREFEEETGWRHEEWEHFVTLCGDDTDPGRQGAVGSRFKVAFFAAWSEVAKLPDVHPTDELLRWERVTALPETVLPNLRWLVPLAWYAHRADWPLLIHERTWRGYPTS